MAKITLVRTDKALPASMEAAREVLFGAFDGLTIEDRRAWRRFWKRLIDFGPGEMVGFATEFARSGPFHRRHMKIEQTIFDAQESFEHFKVFRDWLKVGAGHVEWRPGPRGGIVPIPKSIDYASMEDDEFRAFHVKVIAFLRTQHAAKALWPHLSSTDRTAMIETLLDGFGE